MFVQESGLELFRLVSQQDQITVSTVKCAAHVCAQFHCQVIEVRFVCILGTKILIEFQKLQWQLQRLRRPSWSKE
jgi:ABC-type transport system involved in cytochrome c biogenesis permease component